MTISLRHQWNGAIYPIMTYSFSAQCHPESRSGAGGDTCFRLDVAPSSSLKLGRGRFSHHFWGADPWLPLSDQNITHACRLPIEQYSTRKSVQYDFRLGERITFLFCERWLLAFLQNHSAFVHVSLCFYSIQSGPTLSVPWMKLV